MTGKTTRTVVNRDSLVSYLEEQIVSGRLAEGSKLPSERVIAEEYGLSRPTVREALRDLAGRGLVEIVPGRGAYVRRPRPGDLAGPLEAFYRRQQITPRHLVEARKMIECEAASLAAGRSGRNDLEVMELALARFDLSTDLVDRTRYDIAFHMSIVRAARNPVVEMMYGSIRGFVVQLMLRSLGDPTVSRAGVPYHREIYEAISARDGERARASMSGHLVIVERLYGDDLDRSLHSMFQREIEHLLGPGVTLDDLLEVAVEADRDDLVAP
jgi:GntR family transcriptional regulator, transcriptional repressor for pyruvate dehydrogenase complex